MRHRAQACEDHEDPFIRAPQVPGLECFEPLYRDPELLGYKGWDARQVWSKVENLADVLTAAGRLWFHERTDEVPLGFESRFRAGARRLWDWEGPIKPLHADDDVIGMALGDGGQLLEIWALCSLPAYAASRGLQEPDAEARLDEAWQSVVDRASRNTGCTHVICFGADGRRIDDFDLG